MGHSHCIPFAHPWQAQRMTKETRPRKWSRQFGWCVGQPYGPATWRHPAHKKWTWAICSGAKGCAWDGECQFRVKQKPCVSQGHNFTCQAKAQTSHLQPRMASHWCTPFSRIARILMLVRSCIASWSLVLMDIFTLMPWRMTDAAAARIEKKRTYRSCKSKGKEHACKFSASHQLACLHLCACLCMRLCAYAYAHVWG